MYKAPETAFICGKEYYVKAILNKEVSSNLESEFIRAVYNQYVSIRRAIGGNKCYKMSLIVLKERLENKETYESMKKSLKINDDTVETTLYVAENYIKAVR